jgi:hypothetical protein
MLKHVKSKVPAPKHCTRETAKVLGMALRKDRTKRIQTCARFAELLGECIGAARSAGEGGSLSTGSLSRASALTTGPVSISTPQNLVLPASDHTTGPIAAAKSGLDTNRIIVIGLLVAFVGLVAAIFFTTRNSGEGDEEEKKEAVAEKAGDEQKSAAKLPKNRAMIRTNETGASVLVDGTEQCKTPCTIEVPVGDGVRHEIRIKKDGFVDVVQTWEPKSVTENPPEMPDLKPTIRSG